MQRHHVTSENILCERQKYSANQTITTTEQITDISLQTCSGFQAGGFLRRKSSVSILVMTNNVSLATADNCGNRDDDTNGHLFFFFFTDALSRYVQ